MAKQALHDVAAAVLHLLDQGVAAPQVARGLAAYLVAERRSKDIDLLMRELTALRARQGTVEVTTTSAFPLTTSVQQQLATVIASYYGSDKRIVLEPQLESTTIGGVRAETADWQWDLTIASRLQSLTQLATKTT